MENAAVQVSFLRNLEICSTLSSFSFPSGVLTGKKCPLLQGKLRFDTAALKLKCRVYTQKEHAHTAADDDVAAAGAALALSGFYVNKTPSLSFYEWNCIV